MWKIVTFSLFPGRTGAEPGQGKPCLDLGLEPGTGSLVQSDLKKKKENSWSRIDPHPSIHCTRILSVLLAMILPLHSRCIFNSF